MIEGLITSKTRVKLLLKFFLNPSNSAYLRGLASEFQESSNAVRLELNKLEQSRMIESRLVGNKKYFHVNKNHPLYGEINSIVRKYVGLDVIVDKIAKKLGDLDRVYLTGEMAKGKDNGIIDLIFIGNIDRKYLMNLIEKVESLILRKIRFIIYTKQEFLDLPESNLDKLLIWKQE